jgi:hypothetical protein
MISALHECQWLNSCPGCFKWGKEPYYPWMGPTADLVSLEKTKNLSLMGLELGWLVGSFIGCSLFGW